MPILVPRSQFGIDELCSVTQPVYGGGGFLLPYKEMNGETVFGTRDNVAYLVSVKKYGNSIHKV